MEALLRHGLTDTTTDAPENRPVHITHTRTSPESSNTSTWEQASCDTGDTILYALIRPMSNGVRGNSCFLFLILWHWHPNANATWQFDKS